VVIDLTGRSVARTIPLDKPPRDLEFGQDGKSVYFTKAGVNAVEVLDPASDKVVAEIPTGASPHYVNYLRGTTLGMAVVQGPGELLLFDPVTNLPVRTITVGGQPRKVVVHPMGKEVSVLISNFAFVPASVSIATGSAVAWRNDDGAPHAIALSNGNQVSGTLLPGTTFRKIFDRSGTYDYYCAFHEYMKGRIVVGSP
jgi:YVTN family beta-propeller protein